MSDTYTSGSWFVRDGEEEAFIAAWREFVATGSELEGSRTFTLVRDLSQRNHYLSYAPWDSVEAQQAWRDSPKFAEALANVRAHCEDSSSSTYEFVTQVP